MSQQNTIAMTAAAASNDAGRALWRNTAIALMALLTLVDLFATQAILPSLAAHYHVGAAAMGLAVNASTFGMAAGALAMALAGTRIDRRRGVSLALALLAVPTLLLAHAPDLATFSALRVVQGLAMSAAFALALSYLSEHCSAQAAAGAPPASANDDRTRAALREVKDQLREILTLLERNDKNRV